MLQISTLLILIFFQELFQDGTAYSYLRIMELQNNSTELLKDYKSKAH